MEDAGVSGGKEAGSALRDSLPLVSVLAASFALLCAVAYQGQREAARGDRVLGALDFLAFRFRAGAALALDVVVRASLFSRSPGDASPRGGRGGRVRARGPSRPSGRAPVRGGGRRRVGRDPPPRRRALRRLGPLRDRRPGGGGRGPDLSRSPSHRGFPRGLPRAGRCRGGPSPWAFSRSFSWPSSRGPGPSISFRRTSTRR